MPAPDIAAFGDGSHEVGETGLVVDGGGFGAFPGSLWIYENSDRTGQADQLTIGAWNDLQLTGVEIPGSPNNSPGTRYLFLQREDLAWSQGFAFTLFQTGTLTPESIATLQAFDAPTVTQDHQLQVGDIAQLQVLESPAAATTHILAVSSINQVQVLEAAAVLVDGELLPLDLAQLQALQAVGLDQAHVLVVDELVQVQVFDSPAGTVPGYLVAKSLRVVPAFSGTVSIKPH